MTTSDGQRKHHWACDVSLPLHPHELLIIRLSVSDALLVTYGHEGDKNDSSTSAIDPLTVAPNWALSSLDWHAHAVDAWADHPTGVWIARCGHQLSGSTPLYGVPQGHQCPGCAKWSRSREAGTRTIQ
jgi:hypothetical protein